MALTIALLVIGGIMCFAAWIWLVVAAFRISVVWGLVMLLLSWTLIPIIIFAVQNWNVAKKPVILYGAGIALNIAAYAIMVFVLSASLGEAIDEGGTFVAMPGADVQPPETEVLPPPRPAAEPTHPSWEAVVEEMDRGTDGNWESFVPSPTPDRGRRDLGWEQAASYAGREIVLELTNDTTVTAVLEVVEPDRMRIRHSIGGGEASYWIERDQIRSIRPPG
jgi:hypothetical protein